VNGKNDSSTYQKQKLGASTPQKNNMVALSINKLTKVRPNNLKNTISL